MSLQLQAKKLKLSQPNCKHHKLFSQSQKILNNIVCNGKIVGKIANTESGVPT